LSLNDTQLGTSSLTLLSLLGSSSCEELRRARNLTPEVLAAEALLNLEENFREEGKLVSVMISSQL